MVWPIAKLAPGDRVIFRDDAGHRRAAVRTASTVTGNVRPGWGAEKCRIQDGSEAAASPRISRAPLGPSRGAARDVSIEILRGEV